MKKILVLTVCIAMLLAAVVWAGQPILPYISIYIRTLLDDADAAAARTTLGITVSDLNDIFAETLTAGSVPFADANGLLFQDNDKLFWDDANDFFGIGTNTPTTALDVNGTGTFIDVNISTPSLIYALSHDSFADFASAEHFLQTAITNVSTALATGLLKVTTSSGALSVITDNSTNWNSAYSAIHDAVSVTDSNTVDLTLATQDITAEVLYQSTATVTLSEDASGLKADVNEAALSVTDPNSHDAASVADTNTVDLTLSGQEISAAVLYQSSTTATISEDAGGLKVDVNEAALTITDPNSHDAASIADTNTIDLSLSGQEISAEVLYQTTTTITLSEDASGLMADVNTTYASNWDAAYSAIHDAASVADTNTIDLTLSTQEISADVLYQESTTITLSEDASGLKADVNSTKATNWDTAYGWGDHSSQNYVDWDTDIDTIADGDDANLPTCDNVYDFVTGLGYITADPNSHDAVTVTQSSSITLTLTGQDITADANETYLDTVYDTVGTAAGLIATHNGTYDHNDIADGATAYGWGDHSGQNYVDWDIDIGAVADGDDANVPTCDNVYDFVLALGYITEDPNSHDTATVSQSNSITLTLTGQDITADANETYLATLYEAVDPNLTAIAALTTAADQVIYWTGAGTSAMTGLTAFGRSIIDDANEAVFKATVNLEIGTDVLAPNGDGSALTSVDAATGDSATDFFDSGEIADARISDTLTSSTCTGNSATVTTADDEATDDNHEIVFTTTPSGSAALETDGDFHYNPSTGTVTATAVTATTATITNNIKAVPHHLIFNIINPLATQTEDSEICLWPVTPAALTITKIVVTLNSAANEVAGDIKYADTFIGLASAVLINDFDTTSGVRSDDSMDAGAAGAVPAGKCLYLVFDSAPDTAITQMCVDITFDYD